MAEKVAKANISSLLKNRVKDYFILIKFRLSVTVVFSSLMAYLISSQGAINWKGVLILVLGGFFVTGAANALNQALEKDFDKLMKRTSDRPLAAGRMKMTEAVLLAGVMALVGISLLAFFNVWAAFFGMLALVIYSFIYTPIKRVSPIAIVVGAIPGALPTMIGSVAASGELTLLAFALFAIQFLWQFPHFSSIGYLGFEDYKKAGFKLMAEKAGGPDRNAGLQTLIYAALLVPVSLLPYFLGFTGLFSAIAIFALSVGYLGLSWKFHRIWNKKSALTLMFYSIAYIPVAMIVLFIDKI